MTGLHPTLAQFKGIYTLSLVAEIEFALNLGGHLTITADIQAADSLIAVIHLCQLPLLGGEVFRTQDRRLIVTGIGELLAV